MKIIFKKIKYRTFTPEDYVPIFKKWKVGKGQKVRIVGLGGLGHMGVKIANAMGAHVVLFTTSKNSM
jgi:D-arabinose 1-dehydrogenase-like Zn-dependent alcohol dehydrogenase